MNAIRYGSINSVNSGLGLTQSLYEEHRWTIEQFATDCRPWSVTAGPGATLFARKWLPLGNQEIQVNLNQLDLLKDAGPALLPCRVLFSLAK
jgi:hypothetical protein